LVVTVSTMVLCFFSLISSIVSNIYSHNKEIATFRALGLTKNKLIRLFIYESFVLVLSACVSGVIIGSILGFSVSWT